MDTTHRILIVEDLPTDAELAEREIRKALPGSVFKRVETRETFLEALDEFNPDVIVCDYQMPLFDGMIALLLALEYKPMVPFIMHTGSMNEDTAVECMKAGATDYVIKEHIKRLGPAVIRALDLARLKNDNMLSQHALVEGEARFRRLAENASDMIYRYDLFPERGFSYVNPTATKITGYTPEEHYDDPDIGMKLVHPEDREILEKVFKGECDDGKSQVIRMLAKNGDVVWIEQKNVVVHDDSGRLVSIEGIARDITERIRSREKLQKALEKAKKSDLLKTAFLNNLSHEIRTPLNAIVGFAAFFGEPDMSPEQQSYFAGVIQQSSDQLLGIIEDIINVSTIQTGQLEVHLSETDVNEMIEKCCERFLSKAGMKRIKMVCRPGLKSEDAKVLADEGKLRHILNHVVDNALKFTDQGTVKVESSIVEGKARFSVSDTGIGIEPSESELVFDHFYQSETELSKKRGGLGLGLSVSRSFVEAMGGKIWFESNGDTGTVVHFEVPWKPVSGKVEGEQTKEQNVRKGLKMLVAEDEESNLFLLREFLGNMNLEILHAWNGKQAVELVRENHDIGLVLMDIKMPIMGGYEATGLIKDIRPDLPVVAITAHALSGDREKALNAGCDEYISKPVSVKTLREMVIRYLEL
jgi:PAS domain S-box-containing protein